MAKYLAIFFNIHGNVITVGLFTTEEFQARVEAGEAETKWAKLISADTGEVVEAYTASIEKII